MKKAVILFSGGLDSTTCLAIAKSEGYECYLLSIDYGQRHASEINAAKKIVEHTEAKAHKVVNVDLRAIGGSALTDDAIDVPNYHNNEEIPITYVPARNTIFLSIALGWAEVLDAEAVFVGASCIDYSGYVDCRPEYFKAVQDVYNLATTATADKGKSILIHTPLIHLSKAETIKKGLALGVDYSLTVSCYQATHDGLACGQCDSCMLRKKGFKEASVPDPTRYL
ncbi:MAG: 7-cyano-7-deazaguanine synthase QueC [Gammaproteobacteria bacterium]